MQITPTRTVIMLLDVVTVLTERGVYPRQGHAYAPPTGCGLLLSVTKMPASDTVLQELHTVKHQVLFFPLPSVLALLGTRLYRALE